MLGIIEFLISGIVNMAIELWVPENPMNDIVVRATLPLTLLVS